jgi:CheY-like chemotaxis protein
VCNDGVTKTTTTTQDRPRLLLRVLVAGGIGSVNDGLTALLSDLEGIAVFGCAQAPAKVVALVETMQPDVVLLDFPAAGTSGLQTLRQLKHLPFAPIVIVLSHYALPPLREACLSAGADYFLEKTAAFECLREVLDGLAPTGQGTGGRPDCQSPAERPVCLIPTNTSNLLALGSPSPFAYD